MLSTSKVGHLGTLLEYIVQGVKHEATSSMEHNKSHEVVQMHVLYQTDSTV